MVLYPVYLYIDYCLDSKLVVNVVKTKVVVFRRVGEYLNMKDGIMMVKL